MSNKAHFLLASGYAQPSEPGVHGFVLRADGTLAASGSWAGLARPSFLALHPHGELYAVSETNDGSVSALRLGQRPGEVQLLNQQPGGGDAPCHLTFDPIGNWLAVANYGSGTVRLIPRRPDGTLGTPGPLMQHSGSGSHPERQDRPHAHSTLFSPDGSFAIVADLGIDRLMIYAVDGATGELRPHGAGLCHYGAGPRHMAWHPHGELLYVANELDNTVSIFTFDPKAGALSEGVQLSTVPLGAPESKVADIKLSHAADRLYVSNRGHNSIAAFAVDSAGALSPLAIQPCGGSWPRSIAISPDDRFLVVANQRSGELAVLPVLAGPTALGEPVAQAAVPGAACVLFAAHQPGWFL